MFGDTFAPGWRARRFRFGPRRLPGKGRLFAASRGYRSGGVWRASKKGGDRRRDGSGGFHLEQVAGVGDVRVVALREPLVERLM
jgi:hypothetical protein